jgi:hypothetical protein
MQSNPQGFQQGSFCVIQFVRQRETAAPRHQHPFLERTVVGIKTTEMKSPAKIGMAFLTELTASARLCGVDCNALTGLERLVVAISSLWSGRLYHSGKFMAQDQWSLQSCIPDVTIQVSVQIRSANAGHRGSQQQLVSAGLRRQLKALYPHVLGAVEPGPQHPSI